MPPLQEHVPLAPLTTFRIGGAARYLLRADSLAALRAAAAFARTHSLPVFVLGGGSNLLAPDDGWPGLVIKVEMRGIELLEEDGRALLIAGAGEMWDDLVARAVRDGWWGVENLSGIPGTVGGAVVQNIGAYGAALSQAFAWADALDLDSGEVRRLERAQCGFGYRDSVFKRGRGEVVVRAAFALSRAASPELSYRDLRERFLGTEAPSLPHLREAVLAIRAGKFPDLSREGTAGSFFKNPVLPAAQARALRESHPDMPLFDLPESPGVKVPLAYLLDKGLGLKGLRVGSARLFERQPLVIAADFGARARDVRALAAQVQQKVREAYGISIEPEVCVLD